MQKSRNSGLHFKNNMMSVNAAMLQEKNMDEFAHFTIHTLTAKNKFYAFCMLFGSLQMSFTK